MENNKMRLLPTTYYQLPTKNKGFTPVKSATPTARMRYLTGFTLIELLVVVAIIGVLAAVVILNLDRSQARSRDARRQADLDGLMKATRMYFTEKKILPANPASPSACKPGTGACLGELVSSGYIQTLPLDPKNDATYNYTYYDYTGSANATNGVMFAAVMEAPRRVGPFPYGLHCSDTLNVGKWDEGGTVPTINSTNAQYCVGFMSK